MSTRPEGRARRLELHVEELVVEGLSARDARRFRATLGGELERLLVRHGEPEGLRSAASADVAHVARARHDGPEALARRVARSVYTGLGSVAPQRAPGGEAR